MGAQSKGGGNPSFQPKGSIPNPPGTNPKKRKRALVGSTPLPQVPGAPAAVPGPSGIKISDQLCLNKFAGDIGVGPTCNKKPGSKGYPCTRSHNFSPLAPGAKWPASILDAAMDGANRVGASNPKFAADALAAIVQLC